MFKIFRLYICVLNQIGYSQAETGSIFIVRFQFEKFSHNTRHVRLCCKNTDCYYCSGFPGFRDKLWMIDWRSGYWQGIYQWKNAKAIEEYKKSFVLGIMNRRAKAQSISYDIINDSNIDDYLQSRLH